MAKGDFDGAKALLLKALEAATEALKEGGEAMEVAHDAVEAIHRAHERRGEMR